MSIVGNLPKDPMDRAKKLRDRLRDLAGDIVNLHWSPGQTEVSRELAQFDAETASEAADTIAALGTEVTRLRLGIQHMYYGRMTEKNLYDMTKNWNSDPKPADDSLESPRDHIRNSAERRTSHANRSGLRRHVDERPGSVGSRHPRS